MTSSAGIDWSSLAGQQGAGQRGDLDDKEMDDELNECLKSDSE